MRLVAAILVLTACATVLLCLPGALAQDVTNPTLDLGAPTLTASRIPLAADGTTLDVPWTYTFPNEASASAAMAADESTIHWSLACPLVPTIGLLGDLDTPITFVPGQTEYSGTASLEIVATPDTSADQPADCTVTGDASAGHPSLEAQGTQDFEAEVAYRGALLVNVASPMRQGGPQKQIPYVLEIENVGNARTLVRFDVVGEGPRGKWQVLLPELLLIGPGERQQAVLNVATPYENGFVSGSTNFTLRVQPEHQFDPGLVGPAVDVPLGAKVKGFYLPGPSPVLLVLALGVAIALRSGRRA